MLSTSSATRPRSWSIATQVGDVAVELDALALHQHRRQVVEAAAVVAQAVALVGADPVEDRVGEPDEAVGEPSNRGGSRRGRWCVMAVPCAAAAECSPGRGRGARPRSPIERDRVKCASVHERPGPRVAAAAAAALRRESGSARRCEGPGPRPRAASTCAPCDVAAPRAPVIDLTAAPTPAEVASANAGVGSDRQGRPGETSSAWGQLAGTRGPTPISVGGGGRPPAAAWRSGAAPRSPSRSRRRCRRSRSRRRSPPSTRSRPGSTASPSARSPRGASALRRSTTRPMIGGIGSTP